MGAAERDDVDIGFAQRARIAMHQFEQHGIVHVALLDRSRTFSTTLHPSRGDGVTWPLNRSLSVAAQGTTQASLRIAINVP